MALVTYFELLPGSAAGPVMFWGTTDQESGPPWDGRFISSFYPFTPLSFDGDPVYEFEIVGRNKWTQDAVASLIDDNDNIIASITIPANTEGAIWDAWACGYDLFRFSTTFSITGGTQNLGLRMYYPNCGWYSDDNWSPVVYFTTARIKITQTNPTRSVVHIPIYACPYNNMAYDNFYNYSPFTTTGLEAYGTDIYGTEYADSDTQDDYCQQTVKTVWKYSEDELKPCSLIRFTASVARHGYTPTTKQRVLWGIPNFTYLHAGLWWSTTYGGLCDDNVGHLGWQTAVPYVDTCTGRTFTYITGSEFEWTYAVDGVGYSTGEIEIDKDQFINGRGIYTGQVDNVYGGTTPTGPWQHWAYDWNVSLGGKTINRATIEWSVYYNATSERNEVMMEFTIYWDTIWTPVNVCLWDMTDDSVVADSELYFAGVYPWERQWATITTSLTHDHEYRVRWKATYEPIEFVGICDASIFLYVDPIENFTSYLRVTHNWAGDYDNWTISPDNVDEWYDPFDNIDMGAASMAARVRWNLPTSTTAYYEVSSMIYTSWEVGNPGQPYMSVELWDCGDTQNGTGSEAAPNVFRHEFTASDATGYSKRFRSTPIFLTQGHEFVDVQRAEDSWYYTADGFLIIPYLAGEDENGNGDTGEEELCEELKCQVRIFECGPTTTPILCDVGNVRIPDCDVSSVRCS